MGSALGAAELEKIMAMKHTAGPWAVVKTFNGYRITRVWSSGFYQVMRTPHLHTEAEALACIAAA